MPSKCKFKWKNYQCNGANYPWNEVPLKFLGTCNEKYVHECSVSIGCILYLLIYTLNIKFYSVLEQKELGSINRSREVAAGSDKRVKWLGGITALR